MRQPNRRDDAERDALVLQYQYLPRYVAARTCSPRLRREDFEDAVAWGFLGLLRAAELFDAGRHLRFVTYAFPAVQRSILRFLEELQPTIRTPHASLLKSARPRLRQLAARARRVGRLPDGFDLEEKGREAPDPFAAEELRRALGRVGGLGRRVLREHYLEGRSLAAIGRDVGVTRARVQQVKEEALEQLRLALTTECHSGKDATEVILGTEKGRG